VGTASAYHTAPVGKLHLAGEFGGEGLESEGASAKRDFDH
jgi:hypothetical protein